MSELACHTQVCRISDFRIWGQGQFLLIAMVGTLLSFFLFFNQSQFKEVPFSRSN